jgi:hypothetical protein
MTEYDKRKIMKASVNSTSLATLIEQDLTGKYGPLISNDDWRVALGFVSMDAFRQALVRKTMPVPVFSIANRRGKYALSKDVAIWLSAQRERAMS